MVYFTSNWTKDEILGLMRQVDMKTFCLWQGGTANEIYGAIKDSAYEMFILACSIFQVIGMKYLNPEQISSSLSMDERQVICGNTLLMEI
jgi:hypothetical protein